MEICWQILRYFGYDNNLQIRTALWDDNTVSIQELENARSFEFKKGVVNFLVALYKVNTHKGIFD